MRCCKPSRHDATTCDRDLSAKAAAGDTTALRGAARAQRLRVAALQQRCAARAHRLSALRTCDDECAAGGGAPAALRGACASTFGPSPLRQRVHIATLRTTIDSGLDRRPSSERRALPMALCGRARGLATATHASRAGGFEREGLRLATVAGRAACDRGRVRDREVSRAERHPTAADP